MPRPLLRPRILLLAALSAAHGLTMTRSWLTPIYHGRGQTDLIGAGWPYPPVARIYVVKYGDEWARRVPAVGATIRPGQDLNLVFGLMNGESGGPLISYTSDGIPYAVQEQTVLQVAAGESCS